jgi:hypothetical protein
VPFKLTGEELNLPVENLTRKIKAGEAHSYTFHADAGHYVSGRIELKRTPGVQNFDADFNLYVHLLPVVTLAVYGAENAKIRTNAISWEDRAPVHFSLPTSRCNIPRFSTTFAPSRSIQTEHGNRKFRTKFTRPDVR